MIDSTGKAPAGKKLKKLAKLVGTLLTNGPVKSEAVNHGNPSAHRLSKLFEAGSCRASYSKPRDAGRILRNADLMIAILVCPELKAFVNTILWLFDKSKVIP